MTGRPIATRFASPRLPATAPAQWIVPEADLVNIALRGTAEEFHTPVSTNGIAAHASLAWDESAAHTAATLREQLLRRAVDSRGLDVELSYRRRVRC